MLKSKVHSNRSRTTRTLMMPFPFWVLILTFVNVFGLLANVTTLLLFVFGAKQIRSAKIFPVLLVLTTADTLVMLFVMPLGIVWETRHFAVDHRDKSLLYAFDFVARFVHCLTVQCLTLLAVNLYFYLATPFIYNRHVHQRRALLLVLLSVLGAVAWAATTTTQHSSVTVNINVSHHHQQQQHSNDHNNNMFLACAAPVLLFIVPLCVCCVFGALVLGISIRINRKLLNQIVSIGDRRLTERQRRQFRKQLCRAVLFVLVKTVLNVGFLAPYSILSASVGCSGGTKDLKTFDTLQHLLTINACIDPIITISTQHVYWKSLRKFCIYVVPFTCLERIGATVRKYTIDQFASTGGALSELPLELDSEEFNVALHELRVLRSAVLSACFTPLAVANTSLAHHHPISVRNSVSATTLESQSVKQPCLKSTNL